MFQVHVHAPDDVRVDENELLTFLPLRLHLVQSHLLDSLLCVRDDFQKTRGMLMCHCLLLSRRMLSDDRH